MWAHQWNEHDGWKFENSKCGSQEEEEKSKFLDYNKKKKNGSLYGLISRWIAIIHFENCWSHTNGNCGYREIVALLGQGKDS